MSFSLQRVMAEDFHHKSRTSQLVVAFVQPKFRQPINRATIGQYDGRRVVGRQDEFIFFTIQMKNSCVACVNNPCSLTRLPGLSQQHFQKVDIVQFLDNRGRQNSQNQFSVKDEWSVLRWPNFMPGAYRNTSYNRT